MALISYLSASLPDRTGGIYGHGNTERVRAGADVGSKCHYVCERHRFDEIRGRAGAQFSFQTICGPLYRRAYQSDRLKRPKRPENHLMWTRRALPGHCNRLGTSSDCRHMVQVAQRWFRRWVTQMTSTHGGRRVISRLDKVRSNGSRRGYMRFEN